MNEREIPHTGRSIRDEIRIGARPEIVWQAWADPARVPCWFADRAEGEMEAGNTVTWYWDNGHEQMAHRVLLAEPPRRLVLEHDLPEGLTYIEVTIEQEGGQSVLRLVQSGFGEGPEWDERFDGMASGWMVALAILKHFAERYFERRRTEILVLQDAKFDREELLGLQRTAGGLGRWLSRSAEVGSSVGEPVKIVFENGQTLTGQVLRQTPYETLWSWDEIDGVLEIKAFRGVHWGSKVGIRVMSWLDDVSSLSGMDEWLGKAVTALVATLV